MSENRPSVVQLLDTEPLLVDLPYAAERLSVSTRTIKRLGADGLLDIIKVRRRSLVRTSSLRAFVASLSRAA